MMTTLRRLCLGALALALVMPAVAAGERPVLIPERFLRAWDPVTIFFPNDRGPAGGGPEDHPERLVRLVPDHPGAYQWLDGRTLQFRPALAWPALARFGWEVDGQAVTLVTLMPGPTSTIPPAGAEGLPAVAAITLEFAQSVDPAALAAMTTIELAPLPGLGAEPARRLARGDFDVKTVERPGDEASAVYVLDLHAPIPLGIRASVRLRLSLDDPAEGSLTALEFATARPFRVERLGCRGLSYPVTPGGTRYARDQAIRCPGDERSVLVEFSSEPENLTPVEARNLVRFSPAVTGLAFSVHGRTLEIAGDFAWDTEYRVQLVPIPLRDRGGRRLEMQGESELHLYFPRKPPYLRWGAGQGIVECFGPQQVPIEGRGHERLDLRIHAIDPLDRGFWPFPESPVAVDEAQRPPGPGEEPEPDASRLLDPDLPEIAARIAALGSPPVSTILRLPLEAETGAARFGLDLAPHLARVAGPRRPGTFLVGIRSLDVSTERSWIRIQSTDLCLGTAEEPDAVVFLVTSLATGRPVAGATIRLEGQVDRDSQPAWETLAEGTTDAQGRFRWAAPGAIPEVWTRPRRIVVRLGEDVLVLDPGRPPEGYADNYWQPEEETWLRWAFEPLAERRPQPEELGHLFTDRPVYRPGDEVHIKGYLRRRSEGRLSPLVEAGFLVVRGPGDLEFRYPATPTETGSVYHLFAEKDLPTGGYSAGFETRFGEELARAAFSMEAYRLPRFEISLHAPERVPLDREFEVKLTGRYYAGGQVAERPIRWRVTQFPREWSPRKEPGFHYSSDTMFAAGRRFEASPRLESEATTDAQGAAVLVLNPALEPTLQPRVYLVEATVTGADDETVTAVREIAALPPFVLGLKVDRFLEKASAIEPEIVVLDHDGQPLAGQKVTVRLLRREWHSHLQAGDFSEGVARYVTDVVDERLLEQELTSGPGPQKVRLPIDGDGVYLVEIEARDALARAQVVTLDLYAGGETPVGWPKPPAPVFKVVSDRTSYDPGQTAVLMLQSPFQSASALAVIETPSGFVYEWLDVRGGTAAFKLPIEKSFAPRIPVHFVLVRGRIAGSAPLDSGPLDLGKPATMAATAWLTVNPVENRVQVTLAHPERAMPGTEIEMTVRLADARGLPLAGEVCLWLVDQAVLALGREQRLDPLPDFMTEAPTRFRLHDSRGLAFGKLPFAPLPGGDGAVEEPSLFDRSTVRRIFQAVPYFNPAIAVGPEGTAVVKVKLSDDLTNFMVRAKAASGPDRFGYATSKIAVRLPVIVQPALPRFVRPGDEFTAVAIGRVVEGAGGPGAAEFECQGAQATGPTQRAFEWNVGAPERLEFPVRVDTPPATAAGELAAAEAVFRVAVERTADQASDAFEVRIPVRDDRGRIRRRQLLALEPGGTLRLEPPGEPARPGSLHRTILVSDRPALVKMAAGLSFLLEYPHGCTEQRVSRARACVALHSLRAALALGPAAGPERAVAETMEWIAQTVDSAGLAAFWPGCAGRVSMTAWVVDFLVEARAAGYPVDTALFDRLTRALEAGLRSDSSRFVDGESWAERAWALSALAAAGRFDPGYGAELARKAEYLDLEGMAEVLLAFERAGQGAGPAAAGLRRRLLDGMIVRLHQGREIYAGLHEPRAQRSELILASETRTVAEMLRALGRSPEPDAGRLAILEQALVTLGRGDGWGTTNANAFALLALAESLSGRPADGRAETVQVRLEGEERELALGPESPLAALETGAAGPIEVQRAAGAGPGTLAVRSDASYVPAASGGQAAPEATGFAVQRELAVYRGGAQPPDRTGLDEPGRTVALAIGDIVEDHVRVISPAPRSYVAVVVPLAAGCELLNPNLLTAPPEAAPAGSLTLAPAYAAYLDDRVAFYYDTLPAGNFDFYFRVRALTPGRFVQPPALAELMYDEAVRGQSAGAWIEIAGAAGE